MARPMPLLPPVRGKGVGGWVGGWMTSFLAGRQPHHHPAGRARADRLLDTYPPTHLPTCDQGPRGIVLLLEVLRAQHLHQEEGKEVGRCPQQRGEGAGHQEEEDGRRGQKGEEAAVVPHGCVVVWGCVVGVVGGVWWVGGLILFHGTFDGAFFLKERGKPQQALRGGAGGNNNAGRFNTFSVCVRLWVACMCGG